MKKFIALGLIGLTAGINSAQADVVHADDVIVNRMCVGNPCADGELFSGELEVKHQQPNIYFEDDSLAGNPVNDWDLGLHNNNGGFAITDRGDNGVVNVTPFEIAAGADEDSFYISADGDIGLGTATPASRLSILDNSSIPTLVETTSGVNRMLFTSGLGGGSEVTNGFWSSNTGFWIQQGSNYPLHIQTGAQSYFLNMLANNQMGIGSNTAEADHTLSVYKAGANTKAAHFDGEVTVAGSDPTKMTMTNGTDEWRFSVDATGNLSISRAGSGLTELTLTKSGNIVTYGKVQAYGDVVYHGNAKVNGNLEIVGSCTGC